MGNEIFDFIIYFSELIQIGIYDKGYRKRNKFYLDENRYSELKVRVGIDGGKNAVIQYDIRTNSNKIIKEKNISRNNSRNISNKTYRENKTVEPNKPQLDILGYTINKALKMTQFAESNQTIIGDAVYDKLDTDKKKNFKKIHITNESWNYIDNSNGNVALFT